jgi:hypothetical protein
MINVGLTAFVLLAAAQDKAAKSDPAAQQAFDRMCTVMDRPRTLTMKFEANLGAGGGALSGRLDGVFRLKGSARVFYQIKGDLGLLGKANFTTACNGATSKISGKVADTPLDYGGPAIPAMGWIFASIQTRIGCTALLLSLMGEGKEGLEGLNPDRFTRVRGLKLGARETISGQPAQVLEFVAMPEDADAPKYNVKVWLNTRTFTPIKRSVRWTDAANGQEISINETYSAVTLDAPLEDKDFKAP